MSLVNLITPVCLLCISVVPLFVGNECRGQDSNLSKALNIKPKQADIDFDTPPQSELKNCTIENAQNRFGQAGWVVIDNNGRVIRKFIDSNKDSNLDQWSYYKEGIEVYRDIDSNFDKKADQYRWLGTAGVRWGIDQNQDGIIDSWKIISAEEVSYEVVQSIRHGDARRFARLLINPKEIAQIGVGKQQASQISNRSSSAREDFAAFTKSQKLISSNSKWVHFGGMRPGMIPAGTDGSTADVMIYDSVAAVVDTGGQHGQISIGTLIKVGDAWRAVDLPEPIVQGQTVSNGTLFFHASHSNSETPDVATGENMTTGNQVLFKEYEEIEDAIQSATGRQRSSLHARKATLLTKLVESAATDEDRSNWIRQMADMVSGAYQHGEYEGGKKFLQDYIKQMKQDRFESDDIAYSEYRLITAFFSRQIQEGSQDNVEEVQEAYMNKLKDFVKVHPKSQHAADAMLQLGLSSEFGGETNDAKDWYERIARDFPESGVANKARGANTRLSSKGKQISFSGPTVDGRRFDLASARGKVVLIQYWATWCDPCKEDLKTIKRMFDKYRRQGFVVVSVSLDNSKDELTAYLQKNRLPWIHLYADGGLDGPLAEQLGISLVPTMILIGADGKVVTHNLTANDLDRQISRQYRKDDDE